MKRDASNLLYSQQQLLDRGFLSSRSSWVICAPTGAGKTRMGEWALNMAAEIGRRGIYLAPLKAIVEEKTADWADRYPDISIGLYTGETTRSSQYKRPKNEQFLLMTSEKLAAYLNNWKKNLHWLAEVDVVVIDEFHLLGDQGRGPTIESLIGRLQRINPFIRFIALSATIPNAQDLATWLEAEIFITNWRPVPLSHRIIRFKKAANKPELLINEVAQTANNGGQSLIFVNSRKRSESLAQDLKEAGFRADWYHAGLTYEDRHKRHRFMHQRELDALISTSSLEMGVNFPARKVIVYDSYLFNGNRFGPITVSRYLQFAGRAGRPGLDSYGESVLFLPIWHKGAEDYETAIPEPIRSGFTNKRLLEKEAITEVSTRLSISHNHLLENFLSRTFYATEMASLDISGVVNQLIQADLLKPTGDDKEYLSATSLGRIATQMDVSPECIRILDRFYHHVDEPTRFDCLLAICFCPELTPKLPFHFEQIDDLAQVFTHLPSKLLDKPPHVSQNLLPEKKTSKWFLAAMKTATVLMEHTNGENLEHLAERFDCYPFDISMIKRNCDWLFATAMRIFTIRWRQQWHREHDEDNEASECPQDFHEQRIQELIPMIKHGIPVEACQLIQVNGIGPKRAMALRKLGIITVQDFVSAKPQKISKALKLSPKVCQKIQQKVQEYSLRKTQKKDFSEDAPPLLAHQAIFNCPQGIDPYRLRRALELIVTHRTEECLRVEGGMEPHTIKISFAKTGKRQYWCDCADAAKGNICKHVMRARLEYGDGQELLDALKTFQNQTAPPLRYALGHIWTQGADLQDWYEDRHIDYNGKRFLDRSQAAMRWDR